MIRIFKTERLVLRPIEPADAAFYKQLVNEPAWIANIGDRQVHSLADAEQQIRNKLMSSYAQHGFGLAAVELISTAEPLGICGLVKREALATPDIGFAFLQAHWGRGYALEAARAVLFHAFDELQLPQVLGLTQPSNQKSADLLLKLGFEPQGQVQLGDVSRELYQIANPRVDSGVLSAQGKKPNIFYY